MIFDNEIILYAGGAALQRYGTLVWRQQTPRRGGEQIAYASTRAGGTKYTMAGDGTIIPAAASIPAVEWIDLDTSTQTGARDAVLNLSDFNTANLVTNTTDFSLWTVSGTPVVTGSQPDPFGGTGAYTVSDDDAGVAEFIHETVTSAGSGSRMIGLHVRSNTSSACQIQLQDTTAPAVRGSLTLAFDANGDIQSGFPVGFVRLIRGTNNRPWFWVMFEASGWIGANTNRIEIYPAGTTASSTGAIDVYGAYAANMDSLEGWSLYHGATPNADSFSIPMPSSPQAEQYYHKFIERGTIHQNLLILWHRGLQNTAPFIDVRSTGSFYQAYHEPITGTTDTATLAAAPSVGQQVEHLLTITRSAAGVATMTLEQSIDGAASTSATSSGVAFGGTSWSNGTVYINDRQGTGIGRQGCIALIQTRGTGHTLAEFRELLP